MTLYNQTSRCICKCNRMRYLMLTLTERTYLYTIYYQKKRPNGDLMKIRWYITFQLFLFYAFKNFWRLSDLYPSSQQVEPSIQQHAALSMFLFQFICCLPCVQFIQLSDKKYKKEQLLKVKKYGRASTIFFVCGSIV